MCVPLVYDMKFYYAHFACITFYQTYLSLIICFMSVYLSVSLHCRFFPLLFLFFPRLLMLWLYDKITQICALVCFTLLPRFIRYFSTKFINLGKYIITFPPDSQNIGRNTKEGKKPKWTSVKDVFVSKLPLQYGSW